MGMAAQGYSRGRMIVARNRAFTPFDPSRMPGPLPSRVVTTPAQEAALRRAGVEPLSSASFQRHGPDYPYPAPQIVQTRTNLDDGLAALLIGGTIPIAQFRLFRNTVGDHLRFWVETSNPDSFGLLQFQLTINGLPFTQQQFFTLPFVVNMQGFYREMKSQALVALVAGLRAGAAPLPPLGTIDGQIFVDSYQAKFQ